MSRSTLTPSTRSPQLFTCHLTTSALAIADLSAPTVHTTPLSTPDAEFLKFIQNLNPSALLVSQHSPSFTTHLSQALRHCGASPHVLLTSTSRLDKNELAEHRDQGWRTELVENLVQCDDSGDAEVQAVLLRDRIRELNGILVGDNQKSIASLLTQSAVRLEVAAGEGETSAVTGTSDGRNTVCDGNTSSRQKTRSTQVSRRSRVSTRQSEMMSVQGGNGVSVSSETSSVTIGNDGASSVASVVEESAAVVYFVTNRGKRYHSDKNCFGLRGAKEPKKTENPPEHLSPCKICKPVPAGVHVEEATLVGHGEVFLSTTKGQCYHREGCVALLRTKAESIEKTETPPAGKRACSKCGVDAIRVDKEEDAMVDTEAVTKEGVLEHYGSKFWKTGSGTKFHVKECRYVGESGVECDPATEDLVPCKICSKALFVEWAQNGWT